MVLIVNIHKLMKKLYGQNVYNFYLKMLMFHKNKYYKFQKIQYNKEIQINGGNKEV